MIEKELVNNLTYWDGYSQYYKGLAERGRTENEKLKKILIKTLKKNEQLKSLCDLGCASSGLYQYLQNKHINNIAYSGFDISNELLLEGKKLFPGIYSKHFDITSQDLPQDYDVVYSSEMLSHIKNSFHKEVIKKILKHSTKYALFSMKYCLNESFEQSFFSTLHYMLIRISQNY